LFANFFLMLKGTSEFFGLNHYSTDLCEYGVHTGDYTSYDKDQDVYISKDPAWPPSAADWLKVYIENCIFDVVSTNGFLLI
jgi:hypothetical protein